MGWLRLFNLYKFEIFFILHFRDFEHPTYWVVAADLVASPNILFSFSLHSFFYQIINQNIYDDVCFLLEPRVNFLFDLLKIKNEFVENQTLNSFISYIIWKFYNFFLANLQVFITKNEILAESSTARSLGGRLPIPMDYPRKIGPNCGPISQSQIRGVLAILSARLGQAKAELAGFWQGLFNWIKIT